MKPYILFLTILSIIVASCTNSKQSNENAASKELFQKKNNIDRIITDSTLLVFVKVKGKSVLVPVIDRKYPQKIETTFNILRDKDDRIVFISEMPYNETSEWFISYKSYFDEQGKLFAFQRLNNFLNNKCTHGAAMENSIGYYNDQFKLIDSLYTITDTYKKPLDKKACKFPYNFKYTVVKDLKEYKTLKNIPSI
ncbi:hypothetical protein ADIARSV_1571 [Arcticibacter svalbardensis MN12-7]|uniref:Lipoprotein n=1 Tax=Arcticibacter svalbardensis MN12-7 TaxID=1150600 RepID=R9GU64_9SPHI|nr:hypothetical protein [Arcticibacter svalbardensis]EOR95251.1 hypothetical protein ADIARSV_1571 [Arcticibacter svalbardensis MN12-7]